MAQLSKANRDKLSRLRTQYGKDTKRQTPLQRQKAALKTGDSVRRAARRKGVSVTTGMASQASNRKDSSFNSFSKSANKTTKAAKRAAAKAAKAKTTKPKAAKAKAATKPKATKPKATKPKATKPKTTKAAKPKTTKPKATKSAAKSKLPIGAKTKGAKRSMSAAKGGKGGGGGGGRTYNRDSRGRFA